MVPHISKHTDPLSPTSIIKGNVDSSEFRLKVKDGHAGTVAKVVRGLSEEVNEGGFDTLCLNLHLVVELINV